MFLSDFDFDLPEQLIATRPANPRSSARLLVAKGDKIYDNFQNYYSNGKLSLKNLLKICDSTSEALIRLSKRIFMMVMIF